MDEGPSRIACWKGNTLHGFEAAFSKDMKDGQVPIVVFMLATGIKMAANEKVGVMV